MIDTFNALGAQATPMSFGEVYTSLQQGVIDGAETDHVDLLVENFFEVTKYVSLTGHMYLAAALVCSEKAIEKLPVSKPDAKIEFEEILAYGDNKVIEVGAPIVKGAKVEANLIKNSKNRTILIFKKRRRQNSRRKNGHRQEYSMIRISKIFSKDGKILSEAEKIVQPLKEKNEVKKKVIK